MRFLIVIFSFYLSALSMLPCTDHLAEDHDHKISTGSSHSNEHPADHEDTCPPFCNCNCCGITMYSVNSELLSLEPEIIFETKKNIFKESIYSSFNHTIWQPPKI